MPKTRQELTEILQVRLTKEALEAIRVAADADHTSVAEFCRRALYKAARYGKANGSAK